MCDCESCMCPSCAQRDAALTLYVRYKVTSFGATSLSFLCFIVMYYVHPIGEPPTQKLTADLV